MTEQSWIEQEIETAAPSMRTKWISDSVWRTIPRELRRELLTHLRRDEIVGRYAANIESELRARGEHELARRFLEDLVLLPYPLRSR